MKTLLAPAFFFVPINHIMGYNENFPLFVDLVNVSCMPVLAFLKTSQEKKAYNQSVSEGVEGKRDGNLGVLKVQQN